MSTAKSTVLFTILLPVTRQYNLLSFSVESVLSQTIRSFELFIVSDGAGPEVIECANAFAKKDDRVRVFTFPKGQRHGEAHRHQALMQAQGRFIVGIGDDDLWFPNHLEEMEKLLRTADFGHVIHLGVDANGDFFTHEGNLNQDDCIKKLIETKYNFFGPTVCGYRLSAYRQLETGWSPAPDDIWSDLHMWRKFLVKKELICTTRLAVTALHFSNDVRRQFTAADRQAELRNWVEKIKSPNERDRICQQGLRLYSESLRVAFVSSEARRQAAEYRANAIENATVWKMTLPIRMIGKKIPYRFRRIIRSSLKLMWRSVSGKRYLTYFTS